MMDDFDEQFLEMYEEEYDQIPDADEIPDSLAKKEERQACHTFILNELDCVGEGRRDLDLEIGDEVYWNLTCLDRHTMFTPPSDKPTMRIWTRNHSGLSREQDLIKMKVVGARTLQSGQRKEMKVGPYDQGRQAYLDIWRTHRVIILAENVRRRHYKVLSDDIEVIDDD